MRCWLSGIKLRILNDAIVQLLVADRLRRSGITAVQFQKSYMAAVVWNPQPAGACSQTIREQTAPLHFKEHSLPRFHQASPIEVALREIVSEFIVFPEQLGFLTGLVIDHIHAVRSPVLVEILLVPGKHERL